MGKRLIYQRAERTIVDKESDHGLHMNSIKESPNEGIDRFSLFVDPDSKDQNLNFQKTKRCFLCNVSIL